MIFFVIIGVTFILSGIALSIIKIMDKVEKITDFAQAQNTDIDKIFAQVEEDIKNDNNEQNK